MMYAVVWYGVWYDVCCVMVSCDVEWYGTVRCSILWFSMA
jgi:hypothetical protein